MADPAQRWRTAAVAAASLLPFPAARAEPSIAELLQRPEEQDQKILSDSLENGTRGTFELVDRYHELSIDDEAFSGAADGGADREDEQAFLTRVALGF